MTKICNQTLVDNKEEYANAEIKCMVCSENTIIIFPVSIDIFTKSIDEFIDEHTKKGCNKIQLENLNKKAR